MFERILYCALRWPPVNKSAAGTRTLDVLRLLAKANPKASIAFVTPAPVNAAATGFLKAWNATLASRNVSLDLFHSREDKKGSEDFFPEAMMREASEGGRKDRLIVYDTFLAEEEFGGLVRSFWSKEDLPEVIDTQDLHSLRLARQAVVAGHVLRHAAASTGNEAFIQAIEASANRSGEINPDAVFKIEAAATVIPEGGKEAAAAAQKMWSLDRELLERVRSFRLDSFPRTSDVSPRVLPIVSNLEEQAERFMGREMSSLMRCDLSLLISDHEKDMLNAFHKDESQGLRWPDNSMVLPLPVDSDNYSPGLLFEEREGCMLLGQFRHAANCDSVLVAANLWPRLRERIASKAKGMAPRCHAFGAFAGPLWPRAFKNIDGFSVEGELAGDDEQVGPADCNESPKKCRKTLNSALRSHRLLLAPLRFGAGSKGKLFDALTNGLPVITTCMGVEGFAHPLHGHWPCFDVNDTADTVRGKGLYLGLVRDDEEFLELAARLYVNEGGLWEAVHANTKRLAIEKAAPYDEQASACCARLQQLFTSEYTRPLLANHFRRNSAMTSVMKVELLKLRRELREMRGK